MLLPPLLVAIRALSDLCFGIVSDHLGHLDPWISFHGQLLESPGTPGAFFAKGRLARKKISALCGGGGGGGFGGLGGGGLGGLGGNMGRLIFGLWRG